MSTQQVQLLEQLVEGGFVGSLYIASRGGVSPSGSAFVDGDSSETDGAYVTSLALDQPTDVYWERDTNGDGNYDVSILVEEFSNTGLSLVDGIPISADYNLRLRFENQGSADASYIIAGTQSTR